MSDNAEFTQLMCATLHDLKAGPRSCAEVQRQVERIYSDDRPFHDDDCDEDAGAAETDDDFDERASLFEDETWPDFIKALRALSPVTPDEEMDARLFLLTINVPSCELIYVDQDEVLLFDSAHRLAVGENEYFGIQRWTKL